ncbi:hypothetical protein WA026_019627 [Henosepilachna vigintioctopunctata]|uniref:Uncharacterized protein n=1 Tax=Henosepilachna vigintioctopunctata TaxID=420089 RepID=A0AAW1TYA5_9CUCU
MILGVYLAAKGEILLGTFRIVTVAEGIALAVVGEDLRIWVIHIWGDLYIIFGVIPMRFVFNPGGPRKEFSGEIFIAIGYGEFEFKMNFSYAHRLSRIRLEEPLEKELFFLETLVDEECAADISPLECASSLAIS